MAKAKKEIRPLYPTKHDYEDALSNALEKSMMLYNTVVTVYQLYADRIPEGERIKKALDEYHKAFYGDE